MAHEIVMPRLGWTMEEGVFGEWLKADGDPVAPGDLLFTVESDKATQEVEAFESGILRIPPDAPTNGEIVPVGALLAYLVQEGESPPFALGQPAAAAPAPAAVAPLPASAGSQKAAATLATGSATTRARRQPAISPRARRAAAQLQVDWTTLQGSGQSGRIVERDVLAAAAAPAAPGAKTGVLPLRATPVAQRVAEAAGIDLATVTPSEPDGRIHRKDVEAALRAQEAEAAATPLEAGAGESPAESVPVSRIRQLTAQRMMESAQGTAAVTLVTEADATELVKLYEHLRSLLAPREQPVPGYNDLLIKLTAIALQQHPPLNATWEGKSIRLWKSIHMGLAVDTAEGLVVPVVRDVQAKSASQIAERTRDLIARARSRRLQPDELQGGTFTITNLGMYGIDAFTPIINLPQCAILGVGRIQARPAVVNDQVVPRKLLTLSLTFDHRVVDGGPAARFLNTVREFVEEPLLWMVH